MSEGYKGIEGCKRLDICSNIRDCPVYNGMSKKISDRLSDEGFDTVEDSKRDVSIRHFDGHHQEGDEAVRHRVYLMGYKHEARKGERSCYVSVVMVDGPPELEEELREMHAARRLRLMEEDAA